MLKLTVKAGEYLLVGDDVKVVFTGGSSNNLHILVDAPKSGAQRWRNTGWRQSREMK